MDSNIDFKLFIMIMFFKVIEINTGDSIETADIH